MLLIDMLTWWYTKGWLHRLGMLESHVKNWLEYFSVGILLKTLFSPWRQNGTAGERARRSFLDAFLDNVISRLVGFFVRFFALIAAVVTVFVVIFLNIIYTLIWPVIPALPIVFVIFGGAQ